MTLLAVSGCSGGSQSAPSTLPLATPEPSAQYLAYAGTKTAEEMRYGTLAITMTTETDDASTLRYDVTFDLTRVVGEVTLTASDATTTATSTARVVDDRFFLNLDTPPPDSGFTAKTWYRAEPSTPGVEMVFEVAGARDWMELARSTTGSVTELTPPSAGVNRYEARIDPSRLLAGTASILVRLLRGLPSPRATFDVDATNHVTAITLRAATTAGPFVLTLQYQPTATPPRIETPKGAVPAPVS